jgi:hypothetical protein
MPQQTITPNFNFMARGNIQRGRAKQFKHGIPVKETEALYNAATRNATPSKAAKYSRVTHKKMSTKSSN